jgi:hypothetical protein
MSVPACMVKGGGGLESAALKGYDAACLAL